MERSVKEARKQGGEQIEVFEEKRREAWCGLQHVYLEDRVKEALRVGAARTFFTSLLLYLYIFISTIILAYKQ